MYIVSHTLLKKKKPLNCSFKKSNIKLAILTISKHVQLNSFEYIPNCCIADLQNSFDVINLKQYAH